MPRLAVLRGRPTAGKTTALYNLKKSKRMKEWVFIDFSQLKNNFDNLSDEDRRSYGKRVLFAILKVIMTSRKNIIFDEMSREAINKNLKTQIRKYKYKIIVFQFTVKTDTAYKRDIKRAELLEHPKMGREKIDKLYKMHDDRFDKEAILVDTNKLNKKQVVDLIIKELK